MNKTMPVIPYTVNGKDFENYSDRNTHFIVSTVAFLFGAQERFFEYEDSFQKSVYDNLRKDTRARIIRNLCLLRTAVIRNFSNIQEKITFEYKTLSALPEFIPQSCLMELSEDHITLPHHITMLNQFIVVINRIISDRINNCKELFPLWLKWEYIKNLYIMPNGLTEAGVQENKSLYYERKRFYPYHLYLNWKPVDEGNILYNDEKFVRLLYQWNQDEFTDTSKVSDARKYTKNNIYNFLQESHKTVLVVDCENSDPYKLCATLQNLQPEMLQKVIKVILYDDIHSAAAWDILNSYIKVPVEHIVIERVKQNKSLVDIRLTAGTCREFYQNQVDSFVLVSSDSDYWGLISAIPEAKFFVMVEYEKCGPDIKTALVEKGIFYCYIDDFYSGNCEDIKITALIREANKRFAQMVQVNINDVLNRTLQTTRITLSEEEKKRMINQYFKAVHFEIDASGDIHLKIQKKA